MGGESEGEGGVGGHEGNSGVGDAKKKDAVWSFVSFSSKEETKEPWPPPPYVSLGGVMMDPDPEYIVSICTNN